ncbi:MAG: hypothetical protein DA408_05885 [Bacteroidetes bacterium]|nr:MAG: hypothetical protein C7N36_01785 [Bacteroidota bacterium]PTM13662.1 MAG: hypothetical protein DA408_05885 [Bacteroidota bacterium]
MGKTLFGDYLVGKSYYRLINVSTAFKDNYRLLFERIPIQPNIIMVNLIATNKKNEKLDVFFLT